MAGEPETVVADARGVTKSYPTGDTSTTVLDGVDLQVRAGRFLSVMGPSGSGKSTLLHLLGGLDTPDAGQITIGGHLLSRATDDERTRLRRHHIGIVYQFFNLIPVLTVEENVALPAVIAGTPRKEYAARLEQLVELVGLGDHRHKQPSALSGGQQQRVAIARALFIEPVVLLADEPTGNLDLRAGAEILEVFLHARAELGQTIVMVTHDPSAAAHGDEVLLLRDGRIADRLDVARAVDGTARRRPRPLRAGDTPTAPARPGAAGNGHRPAATRATDPARGVAVLRWLERLDAGGAVRPRTEHPGRPAAPTG